MKTIFYVIGYSSWANKEVKHVFKTKQEADNFAIGLTCPNIYMFKGKTIIDAVNKIF